MFCYKGKVLSPGQLKRLGEHKYKYDSVSLLDPFLQPFWNWLVSKVPLWLAPNLITVLGLIVNIVTTLILVWYSPDAKSESPRWTFFLCAIGLFIYQSLDAIDGKQARRTNSSSPLGELFDHGCDSISTVFVAVSACIAVQLGYSPTWMFFQCFCAVTLFYCAHWQTYVSGTLRFGKIDVTEAQFTIIFIHLVSGVLGPEFWSTKVPGIDVLPVRFSIVVMTIICGSISLVNIFTVVFTGGVGKNGSTVAGTSVLSPVIPLSTVIIPACIIRLKSVQNVYENHPVLYYIAFGLATAKITNKLVVAHMTKNEMEYFDSVLIGPLMLFLNQYFNFYINEYLVLCACTLWVTVDLFLYSAKVCREICDYLHIDLFHIPLVESVVTQANKNESSAVTSRWTDTQVENRRLQQSLYHRTTNGSTDSLIALKTEN